jgi:hypothetical protein
MYTGRVLREDEKDPEDGDSREELPEPHQGTLPPIQGPVATVAIRRRKIGEPPVLEIEVSPELMAHLKEHGEVGVRIFTDIAP